MNHQQVRYRKRAFWLITSFVAMLILLALFIGYDVYRTRQENDELSAPSAVTTSVYEPNTQVISTSYFQFQASDSWKPVANETSAGHYVYRSYNNSSVEQEIAIDINNTQPEVLALVDTSMVLPVTIADESKLDVYADVSQHCQKSAKPDSGRSPRVLEHAQVTFACSPDSTRYSVTIGVVGATNSLILKRLDNTKATYRITYKNWTVHPDVGDLISIAETFESR